jgi:hypothetical protein
MLLSVPAVMTLQLGQVSVLLMLAVALLYWALRGGHALAHGSVMCSKGA